MFAKIAVVALVVAMASVEAGKGRSLMVGDLFYFNDISASRTRDQALVFCRSQGAELARIISPGLYNMLRNDLPSVGGYWIDGIDKNSTDRFEAFEECTKGGINLKDVPVAFTQATCLTLQKAATAALSKVQAVACTTAQRGVLCEINVKGCPDAPSTTTTVKV